MTMKTAFAALALAMTLAGSVQAANTQHNGGLPGWASTAFEVKN
jgi:hypothetical protein